MPKAFLSYNREDQKAARRLRDMLEGHGIKVWLDTARQDSPEPWRYDSINAIASSEYFLTLLGPNGIGGEQDHEINYALKLRKEERIGLIPILIHGYDEFQPNPRADYLKSNYRYHDLRNGLRKRDVRLLAGIIKHVILAPPIPSHRRRSRRRGSQIVALSGGSGSGTGDLCKRLAQQLKKMLGKNACTIVEMSWYYTGSSYTRSVEFTNTYGTANFDNPEIIDFNQMLHDVKHLQSGQPIRSQIYDKRKHAPRTYRVIKPPTHFVLLEGVYLLQAQQIRHMSDATIYVDVEPDIRLARRVDKDVLGFEMGLKEVLDYYFQKVKPAFDKWVEPYKKAANLSIRVGARAHDDLDMDPVIEEIMNFLRVRQR